MTPTDELKLLIKEIRNSGDFNIENLDECFPDDESLIKFCIRFTTSNVHDAFENFLIDNKENENETA